MANTCTQIHIQCVCAVKYRRAPIDKAWKETLHKYITGIVQNCGHKMLAINSMPDHLHFLMGSRPDQSISDLMPMVKGDFSEWINQNEICQTKFRWQEGYIHNQEEHHRKKSFLEEYKELLKEFEIEYDERYIFKALE